MVRAALTNANQSIPLNLSNTQKQQIEMPVEIITSIKEENQQQTSTTTTDTRKYTEKRPKTKNKH